jgi:outer membrane protein TolC
MLKKREAVPETRADKSAAWHTDERRASRVRVEPAAETMQENPRGTSMAIAVVAAGGGQGRTASEATSRDGRPRGSRGRVAALTAFAALAVAGLLPGMRPGDALAQPKKDPAPAQPARPPATAPGAPQAQPAQPAAGQPGQPAGAAAGAPPAGAGGAGGAASELGPGEPDVNKVDPLAQALAPQRGGLTPDSVAQAAVASSPAVRSKEADVSNAEGQTTQAMVTFFPRVTLTAQYMRLSPLDAPSLGGGNIVGTANAGGLRVGPCPDGSGNQCLLDAAGLPAQAQPFKFSFPVILNQISFTGNLTIPVSDYFLRSVQSYSAAKHNEQAARLSLEAQDLQTAADAKVALLQWIQAKGQVVVAVQAIEQVQKQLADAKTGVTVGTASQADVMRIEARLAQAQFQEADARAVETTAAERLRTLMHAPADRSLEVGIDVLTPPVAPKVEGTDALLAEALRNRLDIQAVEEQRAYLEKVADVTAASYAPRLDAFADATLADPNQRIVPNQEKFNFTWDVGARLTWVVNDTFSTIGSVKQARARTAQVDAQKQALVDAVRLEVTSAQADVAKAIPSIEAADRGVAASEESLRVTRKLFAFGKATGTQLVDAETDLTSSRLRKLAAHVNLIAAQIRLEHAVGRDKVKADRKPAGD